ncbi:putative acyltransferase 3 [Plasmopara halstedii]
MCQRFEILAVLRSRICSKIRTQTTRCIVSQQAHAFRKAAQVSYKFANYFLQGTGMLRTHAERETIKHTHDMAITLQVLPGIPPLLVQNEQDKDNQKKCGKTKKATNATAPPTKILFLDGLRGLAALLVVTQHSQEYMQDLNLGAVAVDSFFVLSSFLLTWLFMKKSICLLNQKAGIRKWAFLLADYFSKRFCRVYPLFALTCVALRIMDDEYKSRYYHIEKAATFDLFKTLTFDFESRYFVFWTLPLEIAYYFFIPVFALATLSLRNYWWVPYIPVYWWIITQGWSEYRTSHTGLLPHIPTFLAGSMAAAVFIKLDPWVKASGVHHQIWFKLLLRTIEFTMLAIFLSVAFRGLFFNWIHHNVAPQTPGFPFVSVTLTNLIVCEMILPSPVSSILEWSFLRYWGKVSFSVYLLHSFVLFNTTLNSQDNYYCRLFSRFGLLCLLATLSYQFVEYPSQLLAQGITKALNKQEAKGSDDITFFCSKWWNNFSGLAQHFTSILDFKAYRKSVLLDEHGV